MAQRARFDIEDRRGAVRSLDGALGYAVNECKDDLEAMCNGVAHGNGRLLNCLKKKMPRSAAATNRHRRMLE